MNDLRPISRKKRIKLHMQVCTGHPQNPYLQLVFVYKSCSKKYGIVFGVYGGTKMQLMFFAIKAPYTLRVTLKNGTVNVKPLQASHEQGIVHRTLARCEAFLARVALQEEASISNISNLIMHFKKRGWQVHQNNFAF